jgi:hypothetical protein
MRREYAAEREQRRQAAAVGGTGIKDGLVITTPDSVGPIDRV